jgi:hypothetical protein
MSVAGMVIQGEDFPFHQPPQQNTGFGAYSQQIGSKSQDVIAASVVVGSAGPLSRKDG